MHHLGLFIAGLACSVALGATGFTSAHAEGAPGRSAGSPRPAAVDPRQCARAVTDRVGPWWCVEDASETVVRSSRIAPPEGFCRGSGCWTWISVFESKASVLGPYGYGARTLGDVSLTALDTYSGSALKSRFTFRSSGAAVRDLEFTLRRLDASRDGSGTPITDDFVRSVDPLTSQYTFRLPPNARGIEQSSYHEAEWSVPGYPGTWYVFVRGLQAFRDANGGYRFYDSPIEIMESLPAGGGYAAP